MTNTRIKDQPTDAALTTGDYVIVDSESEGTRKYDLGTGLAGKVNKPSGDGTSGQVLKTNGDGTTQWANESGGGSDVSPYTSNPAALGTASPGSSNNYARGDHVHPLPTIPSASNATPKALGTAAAGSSDDYARADHVHAKPTIPSAATATPQPLGTAAVGSSSKYAKEDHVHAKPSASDIGAAPEVTEVTVSTAGAVSQALDAGKIYHFTGALTALTITLNAAASGFLPQYHFDFLSGAAATTLTLPNTIVMPDSFTVESNKRYEIDIMNNYGVAQSWEVSA